MNSLESTGRLNVRDLLMVFFRRRWIVLGIAVPIIAFGIYGLLTTTDSFTASSQILIEARYLENPSFRPVVVEYDILMSTASQVAASIPVAAKAALILEDSIPILKANDPQLTTINSTQDLRDLILKKISCGQVGESNILAINFTHRNPDLALMVVGAVTDAYREYSVESGQNVKALDYYNEQIKELQAEINDLMVQRVAIYDMAGMTAFQVNNSAGIQQMRQVEYAYHQARSTRQGLEDKYNSLALAVASDPDYVPSTGAREKTTILSAKITLDDAIMELAKLRMSYNDSSTFVVRQTEYVERARQVFDAERQGIVTDLRLELEIERAKEISLLESLGDYKAELTAYPDIERQVYAIDLQVDSQKELLKALQIKRGEIRLKAEGDQRISNITPLNQPSVGFDVASGQKFIYLIFTTIIGIILGLVVALLVDAQDHRIFDRRQAESALEIPVLGAISPSEMSSGKS
jgi:uncharacterized protein involved in exopolysaccharide biosynthesis